MNRTSYCLIIMFLLLGINNGFCQLSGNYTIGGNNPDYATPQDAVNALISQGTGDCVVFNIRPGTYNGFTITAIPNLTYPDSVIFQSETHDSTDVVLTWTLGTVTFNTCTGVTVKWLTLEGVGNPCNTGYSTNITRSTHCNVLNCVISTPNCSGQSYEESAISIAQGNGTSYITIANCRFTGTSSGINIISANTNSYINIINNQIICTGESAIYCSSNCPLSVIGNVLLANVYCVPSTTPGFLKEFNYNTAMSIVRTMRFTQVQGNVFLYTGSNEFTSPLIKDNYFAGSMTNHYGGATICNNFFEKSVGIRNASGTRFSNNTVLWGLAANNSGNLQIIYNHIKGSTYISSDGNFCRLFGNFFYGEVSLDGDNNKVYYNNFSPNAKLINGYKKMDVRYNNLSQNPNLEAGSTLLGNNYFPTGGELEINATQYDPQYLSDTNLRAQNPLLIGKGSYFAAMIVDIDSLQRPHNPTIGANEICIGNLPELDSIQLICGDKIQLKVCSADSSNRYMCLDPLGLSDSLSYEPYATPKQSTTYYLLDSAGDKIDSVFLHVTGLSPVSDDSIGNCTQSVFLNGSYCQGAVYDWTPGEGLSDSTSAHAWAKPLTTTTYIEKVSIPGCSTLWDTVVIEVDYLPLATGGCIYTGPTVRLINNSVCADSIHCDFGDGDTANISPNTPWIIHEYDAPGVYTVLLIACNRFGCDTFASSIPIAIGTDVDELSINSSTIYPNPAISWLYLNTNGIAVNEVFIYSIAGSLISELSVQEQKIDITGLASGVYILEVRTKEATTKKKWVKL